MRADEEHLLQLIAEVRHRTRVLRDLIDRRGARHEVLEGRTEHAHEHASRMALEALRRTRERLRKRPSGRAY